MGIKQVADGSSLRGVLHNGQSTPTACIGLVSDTVAFDKARGFAGKEALPVILIHDITQLYDYVMRIPELAWDLLDFAEKPLTLLLGEGKNLPDPLLREDGEIAVMLVKEPALLTFMKEYRQGFFYLPLGDGDKQEEILSPIDNVIILQEKFLGSSQARVARLGLDGSIKFL